MKCCGLCRTEVRVRGDDWGSVDYLVVLGHQGIGLVRAVGSSVACLAVGDTVGITWIRVSCKCCDSCLGGRENSCGKGYR